MPTSIRLFVSAPLHASAEIDAEAGQAHYLQAVLRQAVGNPVELFNGRDGAWRAAITHLRRDRARFAVQDYLRPQTADPALCLVFAPCKRDATELVVRKATELGATRLQPVITERSQTHRVNPDRWRQIAVEAAEQSERLCMPDIAPLTGLPDILAGWPRGMILAAAIERGGDPPVLDCADDPAALLVGPEGGFTPAEMATLRGLAFIRPVSFGPHILRAETAAIAGLALLQARRQRPTANRLPAAS